MPFKLSTTIGKIPNIPNIKNIEIINEFLEYMRSNGSSEHHQNNNLKVVIAFGSFIGKENSFYDINKREQILEFLNTKVKSYDEDPDKRWITTWNNYLNRLRLFYRWLYNHNNDIDHENWQTPEFIKIKNKKSKRISPYLESEIWEKDQLLSIIQYEPYTRNKAALTLFWDLNGRNHEVTILKLKHIRIKDKYAEGEVPHEAKTGSGPILLTMSFPFVRDWINEHPFKNTPDAYLICNLMTGAPVKSEAMWTMMNQLRNRILKMLDEGLIKDTKEKERLEYLIKTKKWNPYCIRHSSISSDSDFLPEYALKKKVRWSMNSKQGLRYIKRRIGDDLKNQILIRNGIISQNEVNNKPSIHICPRCELVNSIENKYCSKCSYPLKPEAYDEIKNDEDRKLKELEEKHSHEIHIIREEMNEKFKEILNLITKNSKLTLVKPEILLSNINDSE
jgi:integrase/recombinase XerD